MGVAQEMIKKVQLDEEDFINEKDEHERLQHQSFDSSL